jgi:hypothetical protein
VEELQTFHYHQLDFQQLAQQMRALIEAILATQQIKAFPIHPPLIL